MNGKYLPGYCRQLLCILPVIALLSATAVGDDKKESQKEEKQMTAFMISGLLT